MSSRPWYLTSAGFITGHWMQWDDGSQGAAMVIFESEDAASQAKEMIQPPPDDSAAIERLAIGEVVANA